MMSSLYFTASGNAASFSAPAYNSSKAALNMITVWTAQDLKGTNVTINAAHPGWVKTEMGGEGAQLEIEDGAKTAVELATLPADGPTGGYFHMGKPIPRQFALLRLSALAGLGHRFLFARPLDDRDAQEDHAHSGHFADAEMLAVEHPSEKNCHDGIDVGVDRHDRYRQLRHRIDKRTVTYQRSEHDQARHCDHRPSFHVCGKVLEQKRGDHHEEPGCQLLHCPADNRMRLRFLAPLQQRA